MEMDKTSWTYSTIVPAGVQEDVHDTGDADIVGDGEYDGLAVLQLRALVLLAATGVYICFQ